MALAEELSTGEKYHVFLSFRGPDTRYGFADCLFEFLKEAGLRVFMDDEELRVGESIGRKIQEAIKDSKFFVPVFSKGYASSKWCLKEIAWMADCLEEFPGKKEMLPVFYDVDASDVKLKTNLYANALREHEKTIGRKAVKRWRKALIKVPDVKGWNLGADKGQGELIRQIAEDISHRLKIKHRILPDHFIGIDEQVQHIMNALDYGSGDVRFVVIHGMGGIGKTTLASAVFNKICCQYQGCSFLLNVRESAAGNGILNLQNKLMRDILRFSSPNFCDVNEAMNYCRQGSLQSKNVLVVLDDVSEMDQIKKLIGMGDWVGLGSRVIITTRNLSCVANVEDIEIYQMRELGYDNSLQLLCWHAFGQHVPCPGYEQLSHDILSFTKGIPLAIEVIGSCLRGKSEAFWKEMLQKLKKEPDEHLYPAILMSSYEKLSDKEKEIFLDIAFFLAGQDKKSAFYYWEACGLFPEMSIDKLITHALVKIIDDNEFWMHDLIKDLGREVVRKQSNGNLGMRSRLCNEDAKNLLSKGQGTEHVKALKLNSTHAHNFTSAELSGLSGLRFLELCGGNFVKISWWRRLLQNVLSLNKNRQILSELRWLSWRDCALDFGGTNFYLENLVVLKLSKGSGITESWSGWEQFKTATNLKVLELQHLDLTTTPDLSSFLSLERLLFWCCNCLAHIDPSIGNLESLKSLRIVKTINQQPFGSPKLSLLLPSSMGNMRALSVLIIRGVELNQLPDSIGDLESLIELTLSGDGITELPESIGKLRNLIWLSVSNNRLRSLPATIGDLERLEVLDARYNIDLHGEIPGEFGKLRSLKYLDLLGTGICGLPSTMFQLSRLNSLCLDTCNEIQHLPELPSSLTDVTLSLLNGGDHDDYEFDQLSRLRDLQLSCPNPSRLSLLPPGLEELTLYHSTSLSCFERLSYLGSLRTISVCRSFSSEIRLDGLESLTNLETLQIGLCEFLERVHDISRLRKLHILILSDCPKLVEIGGLAQPPESLRHLHVAYCDSILHFPDRLERVSPSELHLKVSGCSKLRDFEGPYDSYNQGGMNPK